MARMARAVAPGCWHHVTQRGNRRQTVFWDDNDRAVYLKLLVRHCLRWSVGIAGYCLMGNHIHLIAVPREASGLARALGRAHCDYARWMNVKLGYVGHLWQNRFYSCILDERHQWEALRYVELNPVRAGLVGRAVDWPWSSAAAHVTGVDATEILETAEWRQRWNADGWRDFLEASSGEEALAKRIREATQTGRPLAEAEFVLQLESELGRVLRPQKRGPKPKAAACTGGSFGVS